MSELSIKAKEMAQMATPGPGAFYQLAVPIEVNKEKVLKSIEKSILASIEFDGGHPWVQVTAKDTKRPDGEVIVADFGCGPKSWANAQFWSWCRNNLEAMAEEIEHLEKRLADHESAPADQAKNGEGK